jgi:hypothetical protein
VATARAVPTNAAPNYGKKGHCRAGFLSRVLPHGKEIFAMQNPKNARQRNDARQRLD